MKTNARNRYSSIPKRNLRNSIIRMLEEQFKLIGSHKVLQLIADEIVITERHLKSAGALSHLRANTSKSDNT